jgi:hypothetical protein
MSPHLALLPLAAGGDLDVRVRIAAVIAAAVMMGIVLELVRRRRLAERYAIVWMLVTGAMLLLAIWTGLLGYAADKLGIAVPANALFLAAFGVAFLLLLHFSVITTRLSEETKMLAQEVARLDTELRALRGDGVAPGANGGEGQPREPSSARVPDQ